MIKLKQFDILAIVLIACTPLLLLETFGITKGLYKIWPIFPFIFGLGSFVIALKSEHRSPIMGGIGVFILLCSIFFFYLNIISWSELATLWPVFVIFLGLSLIIGSYLNKSIVVRISGIGSSLLGIAFAFVFSISYSFWPLTMALLGILILIINHYPKKLGRKE
ncbi:MAG: hypothetical protein N2746_03165 [Deltaproteobacteria bacterium]|nr:hypothetical protein [Deltaproteobacteria bacterium]